MKKIILFIALPLLFGACGQTPPSTVQVNTPILSSEVEKPTIPEENKQVIIRAPSEKKPTAPATKPASDTTKPDPKVEDMTKELDTLIDNIISDK